MENSTVPAVDLLHVDAGLGVLLSQGMTNQVRRLRVNLAEGLKMLGVKMR